MHPKGVTSTSSALSVEDDEPRGPVALARSQERLTDGELVRRAREGDRWAEEALFRRHAAVVAGTVMRLLGNRAEAEDVVQDTFVTALEKLETLREPEAFRGWLLAIAVRDVQQRFRRRKIRRLLGLEPSEPLTGCAEYATDEAGPELRAELRLLDAALAHLPMKERVAWMLRNVDGYSLEETALACGCSLATAKRRIAAAETHVRAHVRLEEEDRG